ncbi:MAG: hypothetical protein CME06_09095 [Gemmatimonadetes bacterium]|nr:hypothetical protein [Gemmatimonadota bacterium]
MQHPLFLLSAASIAAAPVHALSAQEVTQNVLFSHEIVHEIEIELPYGDWFAELESHRLDETYVSGTVTIDGATTDSVGVRFKGNSSYSHPGIKKPFRFSYGEYREDQTLDGLPSVVLNNNFKDPTHIRETIAYSLMREVGGDRASRTGFANVRVNGDLIGFYTLGETVNKTWIQSHVKAGEDGNLWKGDPRGLLTWKGEDPTAYYNDYTLKTNEAENDWSGLIHFIDILNNTPASDLPDSLAGLLDIDRGLEHHAVNIATVNLDSYEGTGHNYYIYRKDSDGRFVHIPWDSNEAFGRFSLGMPPWQLAEMSPLWRSASSRPLVDRVLDVDLYEEMYLRHMRDLLATQFNLDAMEMWIDELASIIRAHVYADPNKMYSNDEFEENIERDIGFGPNFVFGLKSFVEERNDAIGPVLDAALETQTLFINEILADNESTISDEAGDFDDYAEIFNSGAQTVSLDGFGLTDDHLDRFQWTLPADAEVAPGERLMLWLDGETLEGPLHAPFSLSADGEELFLFDAQGELVDFMVFDFQEADVARARYTDGSSWVDELPPTPDAENTAPPEIAWVLADRPFPMPGQAITIDAGINERLSPLAYVHLVVDVGSGPDAIAMTEDAGIWSAEIPGQTLGTDIRFYTRAEDEDGSVATSPAGAPDRSWSMPVFVGTSPLRINEFMADNESTVTDEAGEYEDWIELVNIADFEIDASGYFLSDDEDVARQWALPTGTTIGAGERLLLWADNDSGDLHAPFKLGKSGEEVVLSAPEFLGATIVDSVHFGAQSTDLSQAREPDGLGSWAFAVSATPESRNAGEGFVAMAISNEEPVTIPAGGGSFDPRLTVFNRGAVGGTIEAWTAGVLPGGGELEPLEGPIAISLAGDAYAGEAMTIYVPGTAPSGTGRYELRVGVFGGVVESVDGVDVIKEGYSIGP